MAGLIDFRFRKYSKGNLTVSSINYKPRSFILFQGCKIGHIVGGEVYFYIESNDECLNYEPKLWGIFYDHNEAKKQVKERENEIWKTLNIYHPIKKVRPTYGLW